ncbi:hypothetical protein Hanom_Chr03g00228161 [Helianthus anomalus]
MSPESTIETIASGRNINVRIFRQNPNSARFDASFNFSPSSSSEKGHVVWIR